MRRKVLGLFLSITGAVLNIAINRFCFAAGIPLFLDTILTVSVTLVAGLFWGILCGMLTNIVHHSIWFWGWDAYLFTICNIATAYITWLFMRAFPHELQFLKPSRPVMLKSSRLNMAIGRIVVLMLLSFALCLAMSILGGLLAALIIALEPSRLGLWGVSALLSDTFGYGLPRILVEILSRIPVNIIDRLIVAFGGYGIARAINALLAAYSRTPTAMEGRIKPGMEPSGDST